MSIQTAHPNGHFYSPVTNPSELSARLDELYPTNPRAVGVVFDDLAIERALLDVLAPMLTAYDYPELGPADTELSHFYTQNSQFKHSDLINAA